MAPRSIALILILGIGSCALPEPGVGRSRQGAATARSCAARGLTLDSFGMFGTPTCVRRYADAGKVCRAAADCLGRCLVELGTPETNDRDFSVGTESAGACARQDAIDGCFAVIEDGKVIEAVCVD